MSSIEQQYLSTLSRILTKGQAVPAENERTGTGTIKEHNVVLTHDMSTGFPALTTKRLYWPAVVGELIAFMEGSTDAKRFRELGCGIWDANANKHPNESLNRRNAWLDNPNRKGVDDLGRVYGAQARDFRGLRGNTVDQLATMLSELLNNPYSRRMFVTHANPAEQDLMALPPCHMFYQIGVMPETKTLDLTWYQRSADMFLGVPFNLASYGLLLSIIAKASGYKPGILTGVLFDAHIYEDHRDQVKEQLGNSMSTLPSLEISGIEKGSDLIDMFDNQRVLPKSFELINYVHAPAIKAKMAI